MLSSYRVLDLADARGIFCGRVLADLGADVIKVEPPGGDPSRRVAPFLHGEEGPDRGLFWQLYGANRRGVTLDLETDDGRATLRRLAESADFLIESFEPGRLSSAGLGYEELSGLNPGLVYVSITPFGQNGPYRGYAATDLTGMALAGFMYLTGDEDRPPVRVSVPQFWLLGGAAGAAGAMIAHQHRALTGRGQHVDVSSQQAAARTLSHAPQYWDLNRVNLRRRGPFRPVSERAMRVNWECADGYVNFIQPGGVVGGRNMAALRAWMDEEGYGDPLLSATDFGAIGFGQIGAELLDAMNAGLGRFFAAKPKRYLAEGAIERRVLLFPVNDPSDILEYPQLAARRYFRQIDGPGGGTLDTLGPWIQSDRQPLSLGRRAPTLGEHNAEVLGSAARREIPPPQSSPRGGGGRTIGAETAPALPFAGLKVLDFCWVVIGPMTTRYLADYGATVLRVESAHRPDVLRNGEPFAGGVPGVNRSGYYANYNGGKLSVTLNLADERARAIAFRLATEWADVVAENFTPGVMERWGLGYDRIASVNPSVVMFSASMLGRGGPYDAQPGFGPVLTALSGHTHFTGWPDRTPTSPYGAYTDFLIPHLAVSALASALDHRRDTAEGQHLELSQLEASLYFVGTPLVAFAADGAVETRQGNADPSMAPHNAYRCEGEQRWCAIACEDDAQWRALAALIGRADLADDPRFATLEARKSNEAELDSVVESWTSTLQADDAMRRCQAAGVAAGVVRDCEGLFGDPQLVHRGHYVWVEQAEMGRYAVDGNCFALTEASPTYGPSPLLGEHTEYVCRELLGMPLAEYVRLRDDGALT